MRGVSYLAGVISTAFLVDAILMGNSANILIWSANVIIWFFNNLASE